MKRIVLSILLITAVLPLFAQKNLDSWKRLDPLRGQEINFGKPFRAKYDREHDISLTLQYAVTKNIDIAGTFVFGSGTRATLATQVYYDDFSGRTRDYISERNNYEMPFYHRLDIGANFHFPHEMRKKMESVLSVSVYNVYNNLNPYLIYPDTGQGKLYKVSIFPILPSISYAFKF